MRLNLKRKGKVTLSLKFKSKATLNLNYKSKVEGFCCFTFALQATRSVESKGVKIVADFLPGLEEGVYNLTPANPFCTRISACLPVTSNIYLV